MNGRIGLSPIARRAWPKRGGGKASGREGGGEGLQSAEGDAEGGGAHERANRQGSMERHWKVETSSCGYPAVFWESFEKGKKRDLPCPGVPARSITTC